MREAGSEKCGRILYLTRGTSGFDGQRDVAYESNLGLQSPNAIVVAREGPKRGNLIEI
jgi:hypothetical protein